MSKEDLPPSRTADQFVVRFPAGMRDRIAEAAKASGRSMNAEIVNRLEASFSSGTGLPQALADTIEDAAEVWSLNFDEALERAIMAGVSPEAPEVVIIRPSGSMSRKQFSDLFDVAKTRTHPDATVVVHSGAMTITARPDPQAPVPLINAPAPDQEFVVRGDLDINSPIDTSSRPLPKTKWFERGFNYSIGSVERKSKPGTLVEVARLTIPKDVPKPGDEKLIYDQIASVEKLHGQDCTVWIDVQGRRIPKSVQTAIENLVGFGVGLVVTLEGQSTLSNPDKFAPELMTAIKNAMRGGLVWCPISKKLMHAPHGFV